MADYRLVCTTCARALDRTATDSICPTCAAAPRPGECGRGVLRVEYAAGRDPRRRFPREGAIGAARFLDLLPIDDAALLPPLAVGPSPLRAAPRLREALGLPRLFLKDETGLPSGSLKDRASSLVVAKARESGRATVATASTGNAATSLAAMTAAAGLECVLFVPADAPRAKLAQMLACGARVLRVAGSYDDAYALALEACLHFGWYDRSTAHNPYTIEGKKTVALEIWEQLGREAPDAVVVPVGDGAILAGVAKGFADLRDAGWIDRVPRLVAVQAEGSDAIVSAWEAGRNAVGPLARATTIADSIRVAAPANGAWALRALRETAGLGMRVSDAEIAAAIGELGRLTGVFAEPAAAASLAGLKRVLARGDLAPAATIVLLVTGSGLKDAEAALRAIAPPEPIPPVLDAVRRQVESWGHPG
jgi:threonine synthase